MKAKPRALRIRSNMLVGPKKGDTKRGVALFVRPSCLAYGHKGGVGWDGVVCFIHIYKKQTSRQSMQT